MYISKKYCTVNCMRFFYDVVYMYMRHCYIFLLGMFIGVHGATDITGFGLLGHAQNLAAAQKAPVSFRIHTLPGTVHT